MSDRENKSEVLLQNLANNVSTCMCASHVLRLTDMKSVEKTITEVPTSNLCYLQNCDTLIFQSSFKEKKNIEKPGKMTN